MVLLRYLKHFLGLPTQILEPILSLGDLPDLDDGLLQPHLDRIRRAPHIVDDHVQKNVRALQLIFLPIKRLLGQLVDLAQAAQLLQHLQVLRLVLLA